MPLHSQPWQLAVPERLNHSVLRARYYLETVTQVAYSLVVVTGNFELGAGHLDPVVDIISIFRATGVRRGLEAAVTDVGP